MILIVCCSFFIRADEIDQLAIAFKILSPMSLDEFKQLIQTKNIDDIFQVQKLNDYVLDPNKGSILRESLKSSNPVIRELWHFFSLLAPKKMYEKSAYLFDEYVLNNISNAIASHDKDKNLLNFIDEKVPLFKDFDNKKHFITAAWPFAGKKGKQDVIKLFKNHEFKEFLNKLNFEPEISDNEFARIYNFFITQLLGKRLLGILENTDKRELREAFINQPKALNELFQAIKTEPLDKNVTGFINSAENMDIVTVQEAWPFKEKEKNINVDWSKFSESSKFTGLLADILKALQDNNTEESLNLAERIAHCVTCLDLLGNFDKNQIDTFIKKIKDESTARNIIEGFLTIETLIQDIKEQKEKDEERKRRAIEIEKEKEKIEQFEKQQKEQYQKLTTEEKIKYNKKNIAFLNKKNNELTGKNKKLTEEVDNFKKNSKDLKNKLNNKNIILTPQEEKQIMLDIQNNNDEIHSREIALSKNTAAIQLNNQGEANLRTKLKTAIQNLVLEAKDSDSLIKGFEEIDAEFAALLKKNEDLVKLLLSDQKIQVKNKQKKKDEPEYSSMTLLQYFLEDYDHIRKISVTNFNDNAVKSEEKIVVLLVDKIKQIANKDDSNQQLQKLIEKLITQYENKGNKEDKNVQAIMRASNKTQLVEAFKKLDPDFAKLIEETDDKFAKVLLSKTKLPESILMPKKPDTLLKFFTDNEDIRKAFIENFKDDTINKNDKAISRLNKLIDLENIGISIQKIDQDLVTPTYLNKNYAKHGLLNSKLFNPEEEEEEEELDEDFE